MYAAYLFSLTLGGGLLLVSLLGSFLGGGHGHLLADGHAGDASLGHDHEGPSASKIFTIRTLTYAVFGFGAVGWLMSRMGASPSAPSTIAYAAVGAVVSGTLVNRAFAYLRRTESGTLDTEDSFEGLAGRVSLPLGRDSAGAVVIESGGRRRTLRALPHASAETSTPEGWHEVIVVEMKEGIAYVVPSGGALDSPP